MISEGLADYPSPFHHINDQLFQLKAALKSTSFQIKIISKLINSIIELRKENTKKSAAAPTMELFINRGFILYLLVNR